MGSKNLFIIDSCDEIQKLKLEKFAIKNNIVDLVQKDLEVLIKNSNKENVNQNNQLEQIVYIEEKREILNSCHLYIERDIKSCYIRFYPSKEEEKIERLLSQLEDYVFTFLKIEEMFIQVYPNDFKMMNMMLKKGFENIGIINGMIYLLKEKEKEMSLNGINQKY